jgi:hypothetical protein
MTITVTVRNDDTRLDKRVKVSSNLRDNEKGTMLHSQSTVIKGSETKDIVVPAGQTLSVTYNDVTD